MNPSLSIPRLETHKSRQKSFPADWESRQAGSQLPRREELPHEFRMSLFSPRRNTSRTAPSTNQRAHHGRNYRGNAARFQAIRSPNLAHLSLWLAPRDNEQWDEQIRIAERLGEDPRKMEFEAFARQPQKREKRKKLFTKRHREPSTPS